MLDEWDITWHRRDLPPEVWTFLKTQRFFGMIIPKRHGGLGFSPYAHSEVVRRISAYSIPAGVTVMVPNSCLLYTSARSVTDYLSRQGVAATRLTIEGRGPNDPIGDNATADGRALNRRVEIYLYAVKQ